ncbi:hypothetical protein cg0372 [Corynebacterium glutamicum ATCC 13032]|nr:hypothetical protein cg0372 [Corynebacterium glutamicum ATCC 13032]
MGGLFHFCTVAKIQIPANRSTSVNSAPRFLRFGPHFPEILVPKVRMEEHADE